MIYNALSGLAPQYIRDMYTVTSDVQLWPSRHTDNSTLYLPTDRNLQFLKILSNIHLPKFGIISQWKLEKPNHYNYFILLISNVF